MEYAKISFLLLAYWPDFPRFLKEVASDIVRTLPLSGNLQNMFFLNAQSNFTLTAHHGHFLCHTPGLKHMTPQLCHGLDRPMFA